MRSTTIFAKASFLPVFILSLSIQTTVAQQPWFEEPIELGSTQIHNIFDMRFMDVNGDELPDLITFGPNEIKVFLSLGGGDYGQPYSVVESEFTIQSADAGDIDADGDVDIVWMSLSNPILYANKNSGDGSFSSSESFFIANEFGQGRISIQEDEQEIPRVLVTWRYGYFGIHEYTFGEEVTVREIDEGQVGDGPAYMRDLDNNSFYDYIVLSGYMPGLVKVVFYNKNGATHVESIDHTLNTNDQPVSNLLFEDINNDGLEDIIISTEMHYNDEDIEEHEIITWYKNNGDFTFDRMVVDQGGSGVSGLQLLDADRDGDLDLISAGVVTNNYVQSEDPRKIFWYEKTDSVTFSSKKELVASGFEIQKLKAVDVNNDGITDVLTIAANGSEITWFEMTAGGLASEEKSLLKSSFGASHLLRSADLNGDGLSDIIIGGASYGKGLMWMRNEGDFTFSEIKTIDNNLSDVTDLETTDVNEDGLQDILVLDSKRTPSSDHTNSAEMVTDLIIAYINRGSEGFSMGDTVLIQTNKVTRSSQTKPSIAVADFDGDSQADISFATYKNVYFIKGKGDGSFEIPEVLNFAFDNYAELKVFDINNDLTKELVVFGQKDSVLKTVRPPSYDYIYQANSYDLTQEIEDDTSGYTQLEFTEDLSSFPYANYFRFGAADLTQSGKSDFVVASYFHEPYDRFIGYYAQHLYMVSPSDQNEPVKVRIDSTTYGFRDLEIADLNSDDSPEIISSHLKWTIITNNVETRVEGGTLFFYQNKRDGKMWHKMVIDSLRDNLSSFVVADFDKDGFSDIATVALGEQKVMVYRNRVGLIDPAEPVERVEGFSLSQNYPNPFNPETTISYEIPAFGHVTLKIYNLLGQLVQTLVNESQNYGSHKVRFDASRLSSGVYIYQLKMNDFISTKKMVLVK